MIAFHHTTEFDCIYSEYGKDAGLRQTLTKEVVSNIQHHGRNNAHFSDHGH